MNNLLKFAICFGVFLPDFFSDGILHTKTYRISKLLFT